MIVGALAPNFLVPPVGRGHRRFRNRTSMERRSEGFGSICICNRHLEERYLVCLRIEDRYIVARIFGRAVERTVSVDGRIAPVRRDQVMGKLSLCAPLPRCDD